jgi:hypothetical protein
MLQKIKRIIKKIKTLDTILRFFYYYLIPLINFNFKKILREFSLTRKNYYYSIKKFKNIHAGERCFIVATGPSLTIEDLEKLNNEVCFSMNSIVLALPKTKWRPKYYGIQDMFVYKKIRKEINEVNISYKFFSDRIKKNYEIPKESIVFPHNLLNHKIFHKRYNSKFSPNSFKVVYDGYTITYSLIQIAVYMGFKEIYLIGADTNYDENKRHFIEHGVEDNTYKSAGKRIIEAYKVAKKYADENNIKIYNATRGGMLEVFERVNLEEILKNK